MRAIVCTVFFLVSGCGLLDDDHPPCPSGGGTAPIPAPTIEPPTDPGDFGAAERYRKLQDGTICVCGPYEIGCHDSPEGAVASPPCGYDAQGQPSCEVYSPPPNPGFGWNNETGQDEMMPTQYFNCYYEKLDRQTKSVEDKSRSQRAKDLIQADRLHGEWCDAETDSQRRYVYTPRGCR